MKYRLLALDVDGTLFDSSGRIPSANRQAIARAKDAGTEIVLCTGRGLNESRCAIQQLDHHGPIVLANGSMIANPQSDQTLHRVVLEPHLALEIVEFLDHGQDAVLVLLDPEPTGLDYLVTAAEHLTANTRWWFDTIGAQVRYVDRPSVDDMHHALRVGLVAPPVRMPPIQQSLEEHFGSDIFVQHFMGVGDKNDPVHVLEVFATGVSKWAGLQWLAERRDIEADQVAAIGDEINDVQMIAAAGCGVAMGNAVPAVRQVARYNTATNDEAGVARAIDNMLAGRW